jgi:molybdopterin/thiamine biosynthesis adenylyltransferase
MRVEHLKVTAFEESVLKTKMHGQLRVKGKLMDYDSLTLRNKGYITEDIQEKIRKTKLLIAGCGVGSTIAEAAVRIGFESLNIVDGDIIEEHNLNRQAFSVGDVGCKKVTALGERLRKINPNANIIETDDLVSVDTADELVGSVDLVLDTIDFLDLAGITALHDACQHHRVPIISSASAGWGAVATYFPADGERSFRELFGLPPEGSVGHISYVDSFKVFMESIKNVMMPEVVDAIAVAMTKMDDGKPCPAPHVSVGSAAVASLAVTIAVRMLAGQKITPAPKMIFVDFSAICESEGIDLSS